MLNYFNPEKIGYRIGIWLSRYKFTAGPSRKFAALFDKFDPNDRNIEYLVGIILFIIVFIDMYVSVDCTREYHITSVNDEYFRTRGLAYYMSLIKC